MKAIRNLASFFVGLAIIQAVNGIQDLWCLSIIAYLVGLGIMFYPVLEMVYDKVNNRSDAQQYKQSLFGEEIEETKSECPFRKFIIVLLKSGCALSLYLVAFFTVLTLIILALQNSSLLIIFLVGGSIAGSIGFIGVGGWAVNYFSK